MELIEPEHRQGSNNFSPFMRSRKSNQTYSEAQSLKLARLNEAIFLRNSFPVLSAHILQTTTEPMDVELVVFAILACVSDPRPSRSS